MAELINGFINLLISLDASCDGSGDTMTSLRAEYHRQCVSTADTGKRLSSPTKPHNVAMLVQKIRRENAPVNLWTYVTFRGT